jgi:dTDP-4-amino-4,6-dideoxygalactose transaminase
MGCFSFYADKIVATDEGGMGVTNIRNWLSGCAVSRPIARTSDFEVFNA